jgi:4-amino-4-deoxy-L-arabinose transferase-like glycosyltransferase
MVSLAALVPERVFRRPLELLAHVRESRAASETVLWAGWLATSVLVFGLADSTTTHPYYLLGVATPLAAVTGIGFAALWRAFRQGSWLAWGAPLALAGALAYEVFGARGVADDWAVAIALTALVIATTLMGVALVRRWTETPLAAGGMAVAALALLVLPYLFGLDFGGRIAMPGPGARPPGALAGGPPPGGPPQQRQRVERVSSYIESRGDAGSRFVVGTLSSMDAAPFIRADVPAVAIGGFNGGDPIFTVETFRAMADRGELRYFLISEGPPGFPPPPGARPPGAPPQGAGRPPGPPPGAQQAILTYIRAQWQDVSVEAGLPAGTLYRYRGGP